MDLKSFSKLFINDLKTCEFTDVSIKFIDKEGNEKIKKFHKNVLGLSSKVFKNTFAFTEKDLYVFDNLDSIDITIKAILTFYKYKITIKNSLQALYLVRVCNFFEIPLNFDWISNINYTENRDHLAEILYYIERPEYILVKPINKSIIAKIKATYLLLENLFFDVVNSSNSINVNYIIDKEFHCNNFINLPSRRCSVYEINRKLFLYDEGKFLYEINLHEKKLIKLFEIPSKNFIVYQNKICHLSSIGFLTIYDLESTNSNKIVNRIRFNLPSYDYFHKYSVIIPINYDAEYLIMGIIGNFDAIVVSNLTTISSRPRQKTNLIYCFKENIEEFDPLIKRKIYNCYKNVVNTNENDNIPIIIHQSFSDDTLNNLTSEGYYERFYGLRNGLRNHLCYKELSRIDIYENYYWNNKQQCAIYVFTKSINISSGLSFIESIKYTDDSYIEIINCVDGSVNVINQPVTLMISSTKYSIIAYSIKVQDGYEIILHDLSINKGETILCCNSVSDIEFTCDDKYLIIKECESMNIYSVNEKKILYSKIPYHRYDKGSFFLFLENGNEIEIDT